MPIDPPAPFMGTRRVRTQVQVGVGVVVLCHEEDSSFPSQKKIWAGRRKGRSTHGAGRLALPGGHLELYESWEDCACREVKEEMNLDLDKDTVTFLHVTNDIMKEEEKHYVTIFMLSSCATQQKQQQPINMEPDKCEGWNAYSWEELCALRGTNRLFGPLEKLVRDQPAALLQALSK